MKCSRLRGDSAHCHTTSVSQSLERTRQTAAIMPVLDCERSAFGANRLMYCRFRLSKLLLLMLLCVCLVCRSMLKMLLDPMGGIVITNDGNCILREVRI